MPSLAKRACGRCGRATDAGARCACTPERKPRLKTAERGYDADHRRLRVLCFERDGFRCVDCRWAPPSVEFACEADIPLPPTEVVLDELRGLFARDERHLHADHEIPFEGRPELRLDLANYRTRCNVCHAAKTDREDGGFGHRRKFARNGQKSGVNLAQVGANPPVAAAALHAPVIGDA
jgi:hypothetical protein